MTIHHKRIFNSTSILSNIDFYFPFQSSFFRVERIKDKNGLSRTFTITKFEQVIGLTGGSDLCATFHKISRRRVEVEGPRGWRVRGGSRRGPRKKHLIMKNPFCVSSVQTNQIWLVRPHSEISSTTISSHVHPRNNEENVFSYSFFPHFSSLCFYRLLRFERGLLDSMECFWFS